MRVKKHSPRTSGRQRRRTTSPSLPPRDGDEWHRPRLRCPEQGYDILRVFSETNNAPSLADKAELLTQMKAVPGCAHYTMRRVNNWFSRQRSQEPRTVLAKAAITDWLSRCPDPTFHTVCEWANALNMSPGVAFRHILDINGGIDVPPRHISTTSNPYSEGESAHEPSFDVIPLDGACSFNIPAHGSAVAGSQHLVEIGHGMYGFGPHTWFPENHAGDGTLLLSPIGIDQTHQLACQPPMMQTLISYQNTHLVRCEH
ncbi:hypothetical protein OBBRIDRAFT_306374 [Obba rivulosa]|uniref:Homeobox domain-containing protein n=1 Tax=Obba rivulosa TaxID=1052685 RepID=A0A8E2DPR7_9APHY|nr:hypothetical protein OBBRIDRAFT_306374 [Obba rivulosa]